MKIKLKNTSLVPIGGKQPGEVFRVAASDSQTPQDAYWRARLKDRDGIVISNAAPPKNTSSKKEVLVNE